MTVNNRLTQIFYYHRSPCSFMSEHILQTAIAAGHLDLLSPSLISLCEVPFSKRDANVKGCFLIGEITDYFQMYAASMFSVVDVPIKFGALFPLVLLLSKLELIRIYPTSFISLYNATVRSTILRCVNYNGYLRRSQCITSMSKQEYASKLHDKLLDSQYSEVYELFGATYAITLILGCWHTHLLESLRTFPRWFGHSGNCRRWGSSRFIGIRRFRRPDR